MSDARRIIRERAADDLPEEVRPLGSAGKVVQVTIESGTRDIRFLKLAGIAARRQTSVEEAVLRVRALRDEWD